MAAKPLTKEEKAWVQKVQAVLNECPSNRLAAYSTGLYDITLYDKSFYDQIDEIQTQQNREMGPVVSEIGADVGVLNFPFTIEQG